MSRRIYLGDRDHVFRAALAGALEDRRLHVAEFTRGSELFERVLAAPPDLIVAELDLDAMDGLQLVEWLRRTRPEAAARVMVLVPSADAAVIRACLQRGAVGCLDRRAPAAELAASIDSMVTAWAPLDPSRLAMPEGESSVKAVGHPATPRASRADEERAAIAALRERWHAGDQASPAQGARASSDSHGSRKPRGRSGAIVALAAAAVAATGAALFLPGRLPTDLAGTLGDLGRLTGLAADSALGPVSTAAAEAPGGDEPVPEASARAPGGAPQEQPGRAEGGPVEGTGRQSRGRPPAGRQEGEIPIPEVVAVEQPGGVTSPVGPFSGTPGQPGAGGSQPIEPDYSLVAIRGRPQFVYVESPAVLESGLHPRYPRRLAERKVGGTVSVWVLVSDAGTVEDVRLLRSSGDSELDGAALEALRSARYRPARRGGAPVPTWARQQVVFRTR